MTNHINGIQPKHSHKSNINPTLVDNPDAPLKNPLSTIFIKNFFKTNPLKTIHEQTTQTEIYIHNTLFCYRLNT